MTAQDVALEHAARTRHMQRGPFEDREVEDDAVVAMRTAAQQAGAWVRFLTGTSEQLAVAVLVAHADDQESSDESYQQELAEWTTRPSEARDGLVAAAVDLGGLPRASHVRLRDFTGAPQHTLGTGGDEAPMVEQPLVAVLGTAGDGPSDWVVAGEALCALLLQAEIGGCRPAPRAGPRSAVDASSAGRRARTGRAPADGAAPGPRPPGPRHATETRRRPADLMSA